MLRSFTLLACIAGLAFAVLYYVRESRRHAPIQIDRELVWKKMLELEPGKTVSGKGITVISFYNRGEAPVSVNVSPGVMWSVSDDSFGEWAVEMPIPPEVTALFPRTLSPSESLAATFNSGGQVTLGKRTRIRIPAIIDGRSTMLEGVSKVSIKE